MNHLQVIDYEAERVMTTEQLAAVYGAQSKQIHDNFINNKNNFREGKHYILLTGERLKEFKSYSDKIGLPINKFAPHLYLWTKRGASRHCKLLGTDEAWEQFDKLEETYFEAKNQIDVSQLSPELQVVNNMFQAMAKYELNQKRIENELEETRNDVQDMRTIIALNPKEWRSEVNKIINSIAFRVSGERNYSEIRNESYDLLKARARCDLDRRLSNLRKNMSLEGASRSRIDKANKLDVIASDARLTEIYLSIVKEMAIKYNVRFNRNIV